MRPPEGQVRHPATRHTLLVHKTLELFAPAHTRDPRLHDSAAQLPSILIAIDDRKVRQQKAAGQIRAFQLTARTVPSKRLVSASRYSNGRPGTQRVAILPRSCVTSPSPSWMGA